MLPAQAEGLWTGKASGRQELRAVAWGGWRAPEVRAEGLQQEGTKLSIFPSASDVLLPASAPQPPPGDAKPAGCWAGHGAAAPCWPLQSLNLQHQQVLGKDENKATWNCFS